MTKEEIENNLQIINTLLPISEGAQKRLRLAEKEQLELQLSFFENPNSLNVISIDADEDPFELKKEEVSIDRDNNEYRDRFNRFTYDTTCIEY